jgi:phosphatidylserine decarboxylase
MIIHKEGYSTIVGMLIGITVTLIVTYFFLSGIVWNIIILILTALFLFMLNFFRNPDRSISKTDSSKILCPADGKIVVIEETNESEYFKDKRIQVSIFMSPLNVHVNRNPVSGEVAYFQYHPGAFHKAWEPKASTENERTTVVYKSSKGEILMRQIAGALAKRIVWYIDKGHQVKQGDDMGFIKLGSRVDLFLPLDTKINVKIGQIVKGNIDIIAEL